jgi:hypothetical protein
MAFALFEFLDQCTGCVGDAKADVFHRISRQLDAREFLWDSFSRHLGLDLDFIAENYLFAHGGGSPSKRFMAALLAMRPNMKVADFCGLMLNNGMEDIVSLLDDEDADAFMEYIHWRTEERINIHLNMPKENPRWRIVAERYGFSTREIDTFETEMMMYNLYSPTLRILKAYSQQYPNDNFDKIQAFIQKYI